MLFRSSLNIDGASLDTEDKWLPLDGRWHFVIKEASELNVDAQVSFLPGSSLTIEEGANVIVKGGLTIFNPYEYLHEGQNFNYYPQTSIEQYYRVEPTFAYEYNTPAKLENNGKITVENGGKIAGRITGVVDLPDTVDTVDTVDTQFKIPYFVKTIPRGGTFGYHIVQLWMDEHEYVISVTVFEEINEDITFKILVKNKDGTLINDDTVTIEIIKNGDVTSTKSHNIEDGYATVTFKKECLDHIIVSYEGSNAKGIKPDYQSRQQSCVDEGTLITLSDGTRVPVEELTGDELLLVWNLYTGTFDVAPMIFIDSDPYAEYEIIHLYFSDGTDVKVIYEHGFWDVDLNRYVYINDNDPQQYIGHLFNKQTIDDEGNLQWTEVQLVDVRIYNEYTTAWSPVTAEHLCFYVNGMLSMPGNASGMFNIFEVCPDTLQIDQESYLADVEEYGLYTYEEFSEMLYVPEEIFDIFQAKYFKIAIGKGLTDMDQLAALLEQYSDLLDIEY